MVWVSQKDKEKILCNLLDERDVKTAFIFCNRKRDVDNLARSLKKKKYDARPLHGDMAQKYRNETLDAFKNGEIRLLVCSDVAARGLDVDEVSHVFNYDVPYHPDDYVHRIGRTGRAGKSGEAWMLATSSDEKYIDTIEKNIQRKVPVVKSSDISGQADDGADGSVKNKTSKTGNKNRNTNTKKHQNKKSENNHSERNQPANDKEKGFEGDVPAFFR